MKKLMSNDQKRFVKKSKKDLRRKSLKLFQTAVVKMHERLRDPKTRKH